MATQDTRGILFTHTQHQQGFRLLELPPDLEALLTSKDAPVYVDSSVISFFDYPAPASLSQSILINRCHRLELKSPSTALAQAVVDPSALEYVNFCTPTQTYRIRQVQSSNSLHILRPSPGNISQADIKVVAEEDEDSGALKIPDDAVSSIAKCGSTLELHVPPGGFSAVPFLEKSLQLYDPRSGDDDGDVMMDESSDSPVKKGPAEVRRLRDLVCADIPVCATQCEQGWVEICAFIDGKHELTCWRPSARICLNVWKRMMEGAVLQGIDLEKQFLVGDLWKSVLDDDDMPEPFPKACLEAVVRKLCTAEERPALADELKCEYMLTGNFRLRNVRIQLMQL